MARVRVHQHVNPLAPYFRQAPEPLDLNKIFADPELPLHLDLGCARGRFILKMAELEPNQNFIGVEIREALVDEANRLAAERNLKNLHYSFCNAMLWLSRLLEKIPAGVLQTVTIQFPDPWFKKKHSKRRMVTPELVAALAAVAAPNARIFVQTDIEFLAEEMFDIFRKNERFNEIETDKNPFAVKTERENAVEEKGLPVYRAMWNVK